MASYVAVPVEDCTFEFLYRDIATVPSDAGQMFSKPPSMPVFHTLKDEIAPPIPSSWKLAGKFGRALALRINIPAAYLPSAAVFVGDERYHGVATLEQTAIFRESIPCCGSNNVVQSAAPEIVANFNEHVVDPQDSEDEQLEARTPPSSPPRPRLRAASTPYTNGGHFLDDAVQDRQVHERALQQAQRPAAPAVPVPPRQGQQDPAQVRPPEAAGGALQEGPGQPQRPRVAVFHLDARHGRARGPVPHAGARRVARQLDVLDVLVHHVLLVARVGRRAHVHARLDRLQPQRERVDRPAGGRRLVSGRIHGHAVALELPPELFILGRDRLPVLCHPGVSPSRSVVCASPAQGYEGRGRDIIGSDGPGGKCCLSAPSQRASVAH
ncbi:hypothetical protein ON010_g3029 [Phytophthora cinnamomi]|nr:hypothetical protein ON010_g3029 [Phytophthora cinnamomi]